MKGNLRVTEVAVRGLFGLYDHIVPLSQGERVTIIHGPNGVGKTMLLKLLVAFFNGRFSILRSTPFSQFTVRLNDGSFVSVNRRAMMNEMDGTEDPAFVELTAELSGADGVAVHEIGVSPEIIDLAKRIERDSPFLSPTEEGMYFDRRQGKKLSAEEVVDRYLPESRWSRSVRIPESEADPTRKFRAKVSICFIETNRLLNVVMEPQSEYPGSRQTLINTVNRYARDLHAQIEAALAQYGRKSQQLDQSFPQRLIQEEVAPLPLAQLKERLEALEARHKALSEIGLLDAVPSRPFDTSTLDNVADSKLVPMTLYLSDNEDKIAVLDDLAQRLQLLLGSINKKFRNKSLVINREKGLAAIGRKGEPLLLESLSSGEQHEIVLLYELLFKISPNTLVLIDEPELSLHVTWQKMFLPELLSVSSKVGFDVIVATHSPFIVGDRRDLMVALDASPDDGHEHGGDADAAEGRRGE